MSPRFPHRSTFRIVDLVPISVLKTEARTRLRQNTPPIPLPLKCLNPAVETLPRLTNGTRLPRVIRPV